MRSSSENAASRIFNYIRKKIERNGDGSSVRLGVDEFGGSIGISTAERFEHLGILGRSGSGKTSLMRYMCRQDISAGHGFVFFDLHGDTTPALLGYIAERERTILNDLSARTILIDPSDRERSVGLNILEADGAYSAYVEIAETVQIIRNRWKIESIGGRTDELLRNTLFVLTACGLTFLDIAPLLLNVAARQKWVRQTPPGEARSYFEQRFDLLSPQMQSVYRDAILNKVSLYASDPHFRHLLGQRKSTVNLRAAIDSGAFVFINLDKGRLGEETATLAALIMAKVKHSILGRRSRRLFSLYCDEMQNLVAYDNALDVLLSEARKLGISIVTGNQHLDQLTPTMKSAFAAMGTHAYLNLSGRDASTVSFYSGRSSRLAEQLRTLPPRHFILQRKESSVEQGRVRTQHQPTVISYDLVNRIRKRWTRPRVDIEHELTKRMRYAGKEELGDQWK